MNDVPTIRTWAMTAAAATVACVILIDGTLTAVPPILRIIGALLTGMAAAVAYLGTAVLIAALCWSDMQAARHQRARRLHRTARGTALLDLGHVLPLRSAGLARHGVPHVHAQWRTPQQLHDRADVAEQIGPDATSLLTGQLFDPADEDRWYGGRQAETHAEQVAA